MKSHKQNCFSILGTMQNCILTIKV